MMDRVAHPDTNEPPEDVASLYAWANLHGAKYRDFSAARAQNREKASLRVQSVMREAEPARPEVSPEAPKPAVPVRPPEAPITDEQAHLAELATRLAEQLSGHPAPAQEPPQAAWSHSQPASNPPLSASRNPLASPAAAWTSPPSREMPARPAWITDKPEPAPQPTVPHVPDETIQASRDRLTSRWFALKAVFEGAAPDAEAAPALASTRPPVLAFFSLAGGVGKTSLVATLGRALSARGERVLLVDTASYGLLPFFFGASDQRPGQLRTFNPPATSGDAPIQMITLDPDSLGPENAVQEVLTTEIAKYSIGVSRVIIDLATASGRTARRIFKLSPIVLVPMVPDMNSVVSVGSIDAFFAHNANASAKPPYYVLNQFDPSLPLHLDVREVMREQLGERLLPFALRRAPAVGEALAEGMTIMDYAPSSAIAEDFGSLAGWVKSLSAPASFGFRGVRWSER